MQLRLGSRETVPFIPMHPRHSLCRRRPLDQRYKHRRARRQKLDLAHTAEPVTRKMCVLMANNEPRCDSCVYAIAVFIGHPCRNVLQLRVRGLPFAGAPGSALRWISLKGCNAVAIAANANTCGESGAAVITPTTALAAAHSRRADLPGLGCENGAASKLCGGTAVADDVPLRARITESFRNRGRTYDRDRPRPGVRGLSGAST